MKIKLIVSIFFTVLFALNLLGQQLILQGKVVDSKTKEPLPFATLSSQKNQGGAITNQDGYFRLRVEENDTIYARYTGYRPFVHIVNDSAKGQVNFEMTYSETELTEVSIVAADERAYKFIANVRKQLLKSGYQRSKAFLEIFTEKDSLPTELLELYFNANFRNGNVESLTYKSGRLATAPVDGSFFTSYSTSRVIQSHNPLSSAGFPENVFTTKKSDLRKVYNFKIIKYGSGGETLVFDAKDVYQHSHFSGSISVDKEAVLGEIEFIVNEPDRIPFIPLFEKDSLKPLELHITWIYASNEKGLAPKLINFGYTNISGIPIGPEYSPPYLERLIQADGAVYFYDFDKTFFEPQMVYENRLNDYQKMLNTPYHSRIWQLDRPFAKSERYDRNKQFIEENGAMKTYTDHDGFDMYDGLESIIGHRNVFWSDTSRMRLNLIYHQPNQQEFESTIPRRKKFKLDVEIYFDLLEVDSTISTFSQCLFDVYDSYYAIEHDSLTDIFLNLHFDLCEVERRKFDHALASLDQISPSSALKLYKESKNRLNLLFEKYFRDTDSGISYRALERYNNDLKEETGVDNIELFLPKELLPE